MSLVIKGDTAMQRVCTILRVLVPGVAEAVLRFTFETVNLVYISKARKEPDLIASVGVGNTTINLLAFVFIWSLGATLDTLISRAAGAK